MYEPNPNEDDISTYSNFQEILQKHSELDVTLDFEKKQMIGTVITKYSILKESKKLILDLKGPEVTSIDYLNEEEETIPLSYEIYTENQYKDSLGTPLIIDLGEFSKKNRDEYKNCLKEKSITIRIGFITTEECNAIQFLTKEQTYSKKYPFMFTQCEAILCRTLFPCQDSPSVKSTYRVKTAIERPLTFLFGGIIKSRYYDSSSGKNIMIFDQKIPIPSYLVAFVAGELEYGRISLRCGVWTEKGLCQQACNEFVNAERYIELAEEYLNHPYEWKVYNLLVLPFSFPYGGMENPNLTFVTPSLLAGDGSLANVIGHEISHSWTGNLVTNKNWKNFWINEGFTIFMERKLTEALYGEDMANLEAIVGEKSLSAAIKMFGEDSDFTCLSPNYEGIDPDDGFSTVPYEKGFQFLVFLEKQVGKDVFKEIMQKYIDEYKYQSVDYTAFKGVFENYVLDKFRRKNGRKILNDIDWNKWLTEKGTPSYENEFISKYLTEAEDLVNEFIEGKEDPEKALSTFKEWHTNVKLAFLNYLLDKKEDIDLKTVKRIKTELDLAEGYNMEVRNNWYLLAIHKGLKEEIPNIEEFLKSIGRLKFIRPIYYAWMEKDYNQAKRFFNRNKQLYHPFARRIIQEKFDRKNK